jgi:hypothetical protein
MLSLSCGAAHTALEEKQGELELHVRETFNVAKHADICFVVDGEPIHAHRLIIGLRIASPVFESLLASPNKYLIIILIYIIIIIILIIVLIYIISHIYICLFVYLYLCI